MFDEVITGFRIAYGGAKSYYDVEPDLVTYGKAIGGGLPIGAIGGKKGIMDTFSGSDNAPFIFTGGTFSGNPLTMSAGIAAIEYMKENKNAKIHVTKPGPGTRAPYEHGAFTRRPIKALVC